jgi:hypothetical protein
MRRIVPLLLLSTIVLVAACDERRQPAPPPGTMKGNATPGPETGSTQPTQGGIPAGQSNPQRPTDAGDSQQPAR